MLAQPGIGYCAGSRTYRISEPRLQGTLGPGHAGAGTGKKSRRRGQRCSGRDGKIGPSQADRLSETWKTRKPLNKDASNKIFSLTKPITARRCCAARKKARFQLMIGEQYLPELKGLRVGCR